MIKKVLMGMGLDSFAVAALIIFAGTFVAIAVWAMSRSNKQISNWSSLPLDDGPDPVEPREGALCVLPSEPEAKESCGKCAECSCIGEHDVFAFN